MNKFLIIQTAFIGDVVLATIIIEKLHADFPDAQIDFLLKKGNEGLLENHPFVNKVLIWDKKQHKTKNLFALINIIRCTKYTKVINVQRYFSTGLVTALSGAEEKIGFDKNPLSFLFDVKGKYVIGTKENPIHEVRRSLSLVAHFTSDVSVSVKLYPTQQDYEKAEAIKNNAFLSDGYEVNLSNMILQTEPVEYICIAPCSVWFTKQYPKEKWIEFIKHLGRQTHIFLLGSKSDKLFCDDIKTALPDYPICNLCGEVSFLQSAALMQNAVMNYVNDSAPLHIASAMNAPVIAIFCSTVTWFGFTPLNSNGFVIEKEESLPCKPCTSHGKRTCPQKHFKCANDITVRQLLAPLNRVSV